MSEIAIKVKGLGKRYRLGQREPYKTFRDALSNAASAPLRLIKGLGSNNGSGDQFWALKDVSFEVEPGEVVGIIGRNGAGKSTLLKIISRITTPTEGSVELHGRVGSLLEVGTGFHPELTGRENIYLSGSILGMKRREIEDRFEEIVKFAEIDKFLDTPAKRYSSGMYVRLAFAVAAHLDPEILLVDEVLAVGDINFQKKCLGTMGRLSQDGRTVLLVSHNLSAVKSLCSKVVLLEEGSVKFIGPSDDGVDFYLKSGNIAHYRRNLRSSGIIDKDGIVRLNKINTCNLQGIVTSTFDIREPIFIRVEYDILQCGDIVFPTFSLHNEDSVLLFWAGEQEASLARYERPVGSYMSEATIPGNLLNSGTIYLSVTITSSKIQSAIIYEKNVLSFQIRDRDGVNTARGCYPYPIPGSVRPLLNWRTEYRPLIQGGSNDLSDL